MPRRPSFDPKFDKTKAGTRHAWYVITPGSMTTNGRLKRSYFPDEKAAEKFAGKLRRQYHEGLRSATIGPVLAAQAAEAEELLAPYGISILEAAREVAQRMQASGTTRLFKEQYGLFMEANELEWSSRYRQDMEKLGEKLPRWFFTQKVATIGEGEIDRAIREWSTGRTEVEKWKRMVRAIIANKSKRPKPKAPTLLTADQIKDMLEACEDDAETRAVALLLYAGIRPDARGGEITKLLWEDVGAREITIRPEVSKTNTERRIKIRPALKRLLAGRPRSGLVVPVQWKKRIQRIRKAAGLGSQHQDATRHTFASHHLVAYGEASTQAAMGHTANSRTLFSHYRQAVSESEAKAYFK